MQPNAITLDAPIDLGDPTHSVGYAPGDPVGRRYRLIERLGEGGMGSVWRAEDTTLEREVAIKLVHDQHRDSDVAARLWVEAQAAAHLDHPAIVRVFDVGETDLGDPYLVMELLRGESLSSIVELRGRLPELAAVQLMLPIAGALVVAHAAGIVHRDLKPDNVMVVPAHDDSFTQQPKLVDFGIARREIGPAERRLTVRGALLGSPGYMAPEQAMGHLDIDGRVDVWAFSLVLYELLTGEMPFVRPLVSASLMAVMREEPKSLTELGIDADLWAIIRRGLAKDRDARWSTMADLRAALVDWAQARGASIDVTGASLTSSRPPPARASARPSPVIAEVAPPPSFELAFEPPPLAAGTLYEGPRAAPIPAPPPPAQPMHLSPGARIAALALVASLVVSGMFTLLSH